MWQRVRCIKQIRRPTAPVGPITHSLQRQSPPPSSVLSHSFATHTNDRVAPINRINATGPKANNKSTTNQTASTTNHTTTRTSSPTTAAAAAASFRHGPNTRPSIPIFTDGMLAREFISSSLYQSGEGYFNSDQRVYRSSSPSALDFNSIASRTDYYQQQQVLYNTYDHSWCTPVEIFKPYYAQAIARWILEGRRKDLGEASVPTMINADQEGIHTTTQMEKGDAMNGNATTNQTIDATTSQPSSTASTSHSPSPSPDSNPCVTAPSTPLAPLRIMELGGGNGTCALGILDYLEKHYPDLYAQTEYTIVELSEYMLETQKDTLKHHLTSYLTNLTPNQTSLGIASRSRVRLLNMSITDWRELIPDDTVFVIGLEVLDNMPHDRLRDTKETGLQQVHVVSGSPTSETSASQQYHERIGPVTDRWIIEYGNYWLQFPSKTPKTMSLLQAMRSPNALLPLWFSHKITNLKQRLQLSKSIWFPTTALQFLHILKQYIPHHHLLLADFNHLPSTVEGVCAPVVSKKSVMRKGSSIDYDTYLVEQGTVDIFFPTDFDALKYVYGRVCQGLSDQEIKEGKQNIHVSDAPTSTPVVDPSIASTSHDASSPPPPSSSSRSIVVDPRILSQDEFMTRYGGPTLACTSTRNGWNPMKSDYLNFSFFLS